MDYVIDGAKTLLFVALHRCGDGAQIYWVNTAKISYMTRVAHITFMHFVRDDDGIEIVETPEEIFALIGGGNAK